MEVIVVDGSGEAHAKPVGREYDVTYIAQDEDRGGHAARSLGAQRAVGQYIQFLDDDDRLLPGKFRKQLPLFNEDVGVVYCGIRDEEWGEIRPDEGARGNVLERALAFDTFPCIPSTMLIKRSVVETLLPLHHRHGADDSGMQIELAMRTKFDFVDEPLVDRGKPPDPLSDSWDHIEGRKRVIDTYDELYEHLPRSVRRRALYRVYRLEGMKHFEEARWSISAIRAFAIAASNAPEHRLRRFGLFLCSLLGRPGVRAAKRIVS